MPKFSYSGFDKSGKKKAGVIEADNRKDAQRRLGRLGISIATLKEGEGTNLNISLGGGVKPKEIALFTRQMATVIRSGLDLAEALNVVKSVTPGETLQGIIQEVYNDISTGIPLAEAMGKHKAFSSFLVEMVRAGEASGNLDEVLEKVAGQLEKTMKMRASIKKALTYPTVILVIAILGTALLMVAVVPQFVGILESMDTELPMLTKIVIGISEFFQAYWIIAGIGIAASIFFFNRWKSTDRGTYLFDLFLLRLPVVGDIVQKSSLANFASSLSFSIASGLNIIDALDVTTKIMGVRPMEDALKEVKHRVREGADFSSSLASYEELFPRMMTGMMRVGEASGEMEATLDGVANYYELEVDEATDALGSMIEPFMMIFLGGVVGTIVAAMFLPLMETMNTI